LVFWLLAIVLSGGAIALVLGSSLGSLACATYSDDLTRAQRAYEGSEDERALAIFRLLENDTSRLSDSERAALVKARDGAVRAIHAYADWLEKRQPSMPNWKPMGEAKYNRLLHDVLLMPLDATQVAMLGEVELGRQDDVYSDLFARVADLLPASGRFYLQTMVFGRNMIDPDRIDIEALRGIPPRDSDEWYIALLGRQFPGSWLPFGQEQVIRCAQPHFRLVSSVSGRLDYIETIRQWNARIGAPSLRKTLLKLRLLPRWLTSADFRLAFASGVSANQVCFERELLDHYRLVFEKRPSAGDPARA